MKYRNRNTQARGHLLERPPPIYITVPELSEHWLTTLSQLAGDEQRPCRFIALALESLLPNMFVFAWYKVNLLNRHRNRNYGRNLNRNQLRKRTVRNRNRNQKI